MKEFTIDLHDGRGNQVYVLKIDQLAALAEKGELFASHRQQYADKCLELIAERNTWKCFHCGFETMDRKVAEAHFGDGEGEESLCIFWSTLPDHEKVQAYQEMSVELNNARDELADTKQRIAALTAERDRLREALEVLIAFIPDGWSMPLGYTQVVAQAQAALK